jgi:Protein of unknown function (DUF3017)
MSALPHNPERPARRSHRATTKNRAKAKAEATPAEVSPTGISPAGVSPAEVRPRAAMVAPAGVLGVLPYVLVLLGVAAGLVIAGMGARYAGWGTGLVGCMLLVAALARLALPARKAGMLAARGKAFDVLAFAVLGGAVLALALWLALRVDAATSSSP